MQLIIKNDEGNEIYKRQFKAHELNSFAKCKDCKHFVQHYGLSETAYKPFHPVKCGDQVMFLHELYCGHCVGGRSSKRVNTDDRVCNNFVLNDNPICL